MPNMDNIQKINAKYGRIEILNMHDSHLPTQYDQIVVNISCFSWISILGKCDKKNVTIPINVID